MFEHVWSEFSGIQSMKNVFRLKFHQSIIVGGESIGVSFSKLFQYDTLLVCITVALVKADVLVFINRSR